MGLDGAAYANALSQVTNAVLLLAYIAWRDASMFGQETGST